MRKDSEIFLRKCLQYKTEIGEDAFELNITYFGGIPNIEVEIDEIINELKTLKCISKKSEIIGETIQIYLTLDGITYFSKQKINEKGITINFNGDQINVATNNGRIDAKNYEKDIDNIPKTIVVEGNKNSREVSSGGSGDQLFWLGLIGMLVLTVFYLDYRIKVQLCLVLASIIIEVATVWAYYNSKKAQVIYGKNIKEMSYFNMVGIICIPLLIGIINMPLYTSKIDLDAFKKIVDMDGIIKAFLNSEYAYYAFFQMVGMILLAFFMLHIVCSDFYIIAITNIVIGKRGKWFWNSLFKLTYKRGKDWKIHVSIGILFLVMSILCVIGIVPYIIDVLSNINANNLSKI